MPIWSAIMRQRCAYQHDEGRNVSRSGPYIVALIHQSAWKGNSRSVT